LVLVLISRSCSFLPEAHPGFNVFITRFLKKTPKYGTLCPVFRHRDIFFPEGALTILRSPEGLIVTKVGDEAIFNGIVSKKPVYNLSGDCPIDKYHWIES
jgi:hypothetical protein